MTKLTNLSTKQNSDRTRNKGLDRSSGTRLFSCDYVYDLYCDEPFAPMHRFTLSYKEDNDIAYNFLFRKFALSFFD